MRRFVFAALLACFAALLAFSCASAPPPRLVDGTAWKEIRVNGETITAPMSVYEIAEYDSSGNLIHRVNQLDEWRYEYDSAGRKIHSTRSWLQLSGDGKKKDSIESWYEYDANGRKILKRSDLGHQVRYEHDASGNVILGTSADTTSREWYEYDANGRLSVTLFVSNVLWRKSTEVRFQYDDKGNMICEKTHMVDRHLYPDDPAGHTSERRFEYDEKGRLIHLKDSEGPEEWYEYDDKGNRIGRRNSYGAIFRTDYTFWQNGKVKTKTEYVYHPKDHARP